MSQTSVTHVSLIHVAFSQVGARTESQSHFPKVPLGQIKADKTSSAPENVWQVEPVHGIGFFQAAHLLNISGPIFRGTPTEASQWVRPSGRIDLIPFVTLATPILPFHLSWHKCLKEDQLR